MEQDPNKGMPPAEEKKTEEEKSSTGLDQNVGGLLAYLLGAVTGIIFLIIEKENNFIRFHAMQSVLVFGGLFVIGIVVNFIPIIGILINLIIAPVSLILWIILMIKAYQGERYHLVVAGKMAEEQLEKFN
ncbi:DUF4870 domain-containing protein [Halobacillus andaensis]|uniref:DUF4870 domain-containing protein n=1 Tax=Halobacillus andaensis TaxID=1176239 RepID=UPI003D74FA8B